MALLLNVIVIISVQGINELTQQPHNRHNQKNITIYHFGGSVEQYISILLQFIALIILIILRISESELELLFNWDNLWRILIYGFLILIFLDSALFRGLFRLLISVGYGIVGYLYSGDYFIPIISYATGIVVFIVLMIINFYGVKNLYDV
jgi:hypothetical protein